MQLCVLFADTTFLAMTTPPVDAKMPILLVLILVCLVASIVLMFMRLQALNKQIVTLRQEVGRFSSGMMPAQEPADPATPIPSAPFEPLGDAKLVAVITAAAVAYLGKRVAVRRVTFINQNTVSGWAEAGRLSIHTSHNVRRN